MCVSGAGPYSAPWPSRYGLDISLVVALEPGFCPPGCLEASSHHAVTPFLEIPCRPGPENGRPGAVPAPCERACHARPPACAWDVWPRPHILHTGISRRAELHWTPDRFLGVFRKSPPMPRLEYLIRSNFHEEAENASRSHGGEERERMKAYDQAVGIPLNKPGPWVGN